MTMEFLSKLRSWLGGGGGSGRFLEIYALNFRCQEPLSTRIDMYNDLSPVDEGSGVKGAEYYVRKVVSTSGDQRCFDSCEIQVWLNGRRQEINREIAGGQFLSAEEYAEAQADFQRRIRNSD